MAMLWALALLLILESLAAVTLAATAARIRLLGDRRLAIEADLALGTALAELRVTHDSALAALSPGSVAVLAPPAIAGWEVRATASREGAAAVVRLDAAVMRRDGAGRPLASRRGTLLLVTGSADTAIVLDSRPRW